MLADAFLSEFAMSSKCHRKLLYGICGTVDIELLNREGCFFQVILEKT